ncbi:MAG TPA: dipeptidase [Planctomycetota bacterium]|nr:dipeptidase [Planctomycetota bacterium]
MLAHQAVALFTLSSLVLAQDAPTAEAELQARARAIHARVLTLDTHKDISAQLAPEQLPEEPQARAEYRARFDPTVRGSNQVDFPKMRAGGYDCAFFIVYVGQGPLTDAGFHRATEQALAKFDAIDRMARLYPQEIGLARTPDDVEKIWNSGKLVACIGIENGYSMGEDLSLIARFHARGARYMGIAHNKHSQLGDSHTPDEPLHHGLSELGKKAIAEMNRVGIMVDVSHSSRATMLQALAISKAPVLASHSGCRALCDHGRDLDDDQLLALKANGGVIQCVAFADYVKAGPERTAAVAALRQELGLGGRHGGDSGAESDDLEQRLAKFRERMQAVDQKYPPANVHDFVDHIDHAVKVIGIDHVGISSDFDGGGGVQGWNDASETANVTIELVRRGYTEPQIGKLWSGNTLRLWREVEAVSKKLQAEAR